MTTESSILKLAYKTFAVQIDDIEIVAEMPKPRTDEEHVEMLKEELEKYGQLEPLIVSKGITKEFALQKGFHRYEALRRLGVKEVEVKMPVEDLVEGHILAMKMRIKRRPLNPIEVAESAEWLHSVKGWKYKKIAEEFGVTDSFIRKCRKILHSGDFELIEQVRKGRVRFKEALKILSEREQTESENWHDSNEEWWNKPVQCQHCNETATKGESIRICMQCYQELLQLERRIKELEKAVKRLGSKEQQQLANEIEYKEWNLDDII